MAGRRGEHRIVERLRDLRVILEIWMFWVHHHKCNGFKEVNHMGIQGKMYGLFCDEHGKGIAI